VVKSSLDFLKNKKQLFYTFRIIAIVLLLLLIFKGVVFFVLLIGLSLSMSFIVNNLGLRRIGLEMVTFIAVLSGLKYGPWIALGITFVLITYHLVMGGFIGEYVLWVIPSYCIAAIIAGFFPQADIQQLGIYSTAGINIISTFFTAVRSPGYLAQYMLYVVTNILFNVFLFTVFGKILLFFI
jgi:hypothetical protein